MEKAQVAGSRPPEAEWSRAEGTPVMVMILAAAQAILIRFC